MCRKNDSSQTVESITFKNIRRMIKPLSARVIETMKPGSPVMSNASENTGLRVKCAKGGTKTFFYRYRSPETEKLTQLKIGKPHIFRFDLSHLSPRIISSY